MTRRGQRKGGRRAIFAGAAVAAATLLLILGLRKGGFTGVQAAPAPSIAAARAGLPDGPDGRLGGVGRIGTTEAAFRPSEAGILLAALRRKFAAGASIDEIGALLDRLAEKDPLSVPIAIEEAAQAGCDNLPELLQAATEALLKAGHEDVAIQAVDTWAAGPLGGALNNAVFEDVSGRLAQASLPNALGWLRALPSSEGRNYALGSLAAGWAAADPGAAMNWAMTLSPADGRADVMQRVFNRWSNQDAVVAVQWLGAHGSDPASDQMITEFVGDSPLLQADPSLAATWAESISDPALRQSTFASVILPWGRADPDAAARYLAADPLLPGDQAKQLLPRVGAP